MRFASVVQTCVSCRAKIYIRRKIAQLSRHAWNHPDVWTFSIVFAGKSWVKVIEWSRSFTLHVNDKQRRKYDLPRRDTIWCFGTSRLVLKSCAVFRQGEVYCLVVLCKHRVGLLLVHTECALTMLLFVQGGPLKNWKSINYISK